MSVTSRTYTTVVSIHEASDGCAMVTFTTLICTHVSPIVLMPSYMDNRASGFSTQGCCRKGVHDTHHAKHLLLCPYMLVHGLNEGTVCRRTWRWFPSRQYIAIEAKSLGFASTVAYHIAEAEITGVCVDE